MQKKIVLIGGPGTGKSSVLKQLKSSGFCCMEEISRQITIRAQEEGGRTIVFNRTYIV